MYTLQGQQNKFAVKNWKNISLFAGTSYKNSVSGVKGKRILKQKADL